MDPLSFASSVVGFKQAIGRLRSALSQYRDHRRTTSNTHRVWLYTQQVEHLIDALVSFLSHEDGEQLPDSQLKFIEGLLEDALPYVKRLSERLCGPLSGTNRATSFTWTMMGADGPMKELLDVFERLSEHLNIMFTLVTSGAKPIPTRLSRDHLGDDPLLIFLNDPPKHQPNLEANLQHSALFEDYVKLLTTRQRRSIEVIHFKSTPVGVITLPSTKNPSSDEIAIHVEKLDEWLHNTDPLAMSDADDQSDMQQQQTSPESTIEINERTPAAHIILCTPGSSRTSNPVISFTEPQYVHIMQRFSFPEEFVVALVTACPTYRVIRPSGKFQTSSVCRFMLRMPLSTTNNWTLATSWDTKSGMIHHLLHGLSNLEHESLLVALQDFRDLPAHPFILPAVLCEMLTDSDMNEIKRHAVNLHSVELRTNYLQLKDLTEHAPQAEDELEGLTRRVNAVMSRLSFHEMRVQTCSRLVSSIRHLSQTLVHRIRLDKFERLKVSEMILFEILEKLTSNHEMLLIDITCNQKIATGQLQILYNITAQRDNRNSLGLAKTSTKIARITMEDSFAMRIIAIMTIFFLPCTAVSSIFSMSMFNWLPDIDDNTRRPVVSQYFWVYWIVTGILTLIVIAIWLIWLHYHRRTEAIRQESSSGRLFAAPRSQYHLRPASNQMDDIEISKPEGAIENLGSQTRLTAIGRQKLSNDRLQIGEATRQTKTFVQGPMR